MNELTVEILTDAMSDRRVMAAMEMAIRDRLIQKAFDRMKREGVRSCQAIERIAETFFLSDEAVRTVVYKRRYKN